MNNYLPQVFTFKHRIGEIFTDESGDIIEIAGYNYLHGSCYRGKVTIDLNGSPTTFDSNFIYEDRLEKMTKVNSREEAINLTKKKETIYKIYFFEYNPNTTSVKGQKAQNMTLKLSGISQLCKTLNNMLKKFPERRITLVSIVNEEGIYQNHVKFLRQEIQNQKFLTGMKERLLAHAKYERGFEVSIGF
jgi:hypothetical protein